MVVRIGLVRSLRARSISPQISSGILHSRLASEGRSAVSKEEHLAILRGGVEGWNDWRTSNPDVQPDLRNSNLKGTDLRSANLGWVNFNGANLEGANMISTDLKRSSCCGTNLHAADLGRSNMNHTNFSGADLSEANLSRTAISGTNFSRANLKNSNFTMAYLTEAIFADNDLSTVFGLKSVRHRGPSAISFETLYKSAKSVPKEFLVGCGVPDVFISYLPSLIDAEEAVQFYSCFISYSHSDEEFAKRLYSRMRQDHIRVWFAPEDIKGGEKLYEQIDRAIQIHDRILIVLSHSSMRSQWVITEILKARRAEATCGYRKLFPIRLVGFEELREWECFDADDGKDLAIEVREYFIPDFSNWKDSAAFESAFQRLLRDLKTAQREIDSRVSSRPGS